MGWRRGPKIRNRDAADRVFHVRASSFLLYMRRYSDILKHALSFLTSIVKLFTISRRMLCPAADWVSVSLKFHKTRSLYKLPIIHFHVVLVPLPRARIPAFIHCVSSVSCHFGLAEPCAFPGFIGVHPVPFTGIPLLPGGSRSTP